MAHDLSKLQKVKRILRRNQRQLETTKCEETKELLNRKINKLTKEIEEINAADKPEEKKARIRISDHAIVRYFERVLGFDIKKIKEEILSDQLSDQISTLRDGTFPNGNFRLKVREYTVVTVVE